jgi:hypothetical protein
VKSIIKLEENCSAINWHFFAINIRSITRSHDNFLLETWIKLDADNSDKMDSRCDN